MGCPADSDTHPTHGELPNAPYQCAQICVGADDNGNEYIEVSGTYNHIGAFSYNLKCEASVRLYAGRTTFPISMKITNEFYQDSDLMYMAHTNYLPVEGSTILYAVHAHPTPSCASRALML